MDLVVVKHEEPMVSSIILADGMHLEHRSVISLIEKYKTILEERGNLRFEMLRLQNKKTGPKVKVVWLNKRQFTFLVMLMKNSSPVVDFKNKLEDAFDKQEKLIAHLLMQRHNQAWLEQRQQGKISRRQETDAIQDFIEYAKSQGSTHADKYYIHFTKATYKSLFVLEQEFKEVRNILNGQQLQILASADIAVAKAIAHGMEQNMHYKEIFQYAKQRLLDFADIVGKSLIPTSQLTISASNHQDS